MRVTNEQAMCDKGNFPDKSDLYKYAADLLEAREIIKEYHKICKEVVAWNVAYRPLIDLLERTKEYQ